MSRSKVTLQGHQGQKRVRSTQHFTGATICVADELSFTSFTSACVCVCVCVFDSCYYNNDVHRRADHDADYVRYSYLLHQTCRQIVCNRPGDLKKLLVEATQSTSPSPRPSCLPRQFLDTFGFPFVSYFMYDT